MDNNNIKISACILSRDDDQFIENCVTNIVPYVDELIILDSNDNDTSIDKVRSIPCHQHKIVIRHNKGDIAQDFSKERNKMQSIASGDYVLHIDCDEIFDVKFLENMRDIIKSYIDNNILPISFRFPRINRLDNYYDYQTRLLYKKHTIWKRMSHEVPYVVMLPEDPIQEIGMNIINRVTLDYPITHLYKQRDQLQKRWIDIIHKDPFHKRKKLLVLSLFKNSSMWTKDILKCMQNVHRFNERLYDNNPNKLNINFSFVDGNSNDDTFQILENFCKQINILDIQLRQFDPLNDPSDVQGKRSRFRKLANARNHIIEQSVIEFPLNDDDYILFIDSDIRFTGNIVQEFIKDMEMYQADIIAPIIYIEDFREFGNYYFYDTLAFRSLDGSRFRHIPPYTTNLSKNRPFQVGSVGSFYLMKYKVAKLVKYTGEKDSEQVEFCNNVRTKGFKIFMSPRLSVLHINLDKYNLEWH